MVVVYVCGDYFNKAEDTRSLVFIWIAVLAACLVLGRFMTGVGIIYPPSSHWGSS